MVTLLNQWILLIDVLGNKKEAEKLYEFRGYSC